MIINLSIFLQGTKLHISTKKQLCLDNPQNPPLSYVEVCDKAKDSYGDNIACYSAPNGNEFDYIIQNLFLHPCFTMGALASTRSHCEAKGGYIPTIPTVKEHINCQISIMSIYFPIIFILQTEIVK